VALVLKAVLAGALVATLTACTSDGDPPAPPDITTAEAFGAIVRWEVARHDPVVDQGGDATLPVIYLRAASGGTVDIGVQADVVSAVVDDAVIRFSDDADDSLNEDLEGAPVKDDGVLLIVSSLATGGATMDVVVRRYQSIDDDISWHMQIVASDEGAKVTEAVEATTPLD
jgi:hypothetical protein